MHSCNPSGQTDRLSMLGKDWVLCRNLVYNHLAHWLLAALSALSNLQCWAFKKECPTRIRESGGVHWRTEDREA